MRFKIGDTVDYCDAPSNTVTLEEALLRKDLDEGVKQELREMADYLTARFLEHKEVIEITYHPPTGKLYLVRLGVPNLQRVTH